MKSRLQNKIISLLERSVGIGKVDAQVTVDLDFEEISTTQEIFDPESQVARSTQLIEEESTLDEREPNRTVGVANNLPTGADEGEEAATSNEETIRAEETVNYEISRTVRNETRRGGAVRRISVAVQVDGNYTTGADGASVFEPRSSDELIEIEELVRTAVGLDDERGDTLTVVSRQLVDMPVVGESEPGMFEFDRNQIMRMAEIGILAVIALFVLMFGMRPILTRLLPSPTKEEQAQETRISLTHDGKPMLVHAPTGAEISVDATGRPIILREPQVVVHERNAASTNDKEAESGDPDETVKLGNIEGEVRSSLLNNVCRGSRRPAGKMLCASFVIGCMNEKDAKIDGY